MNKINVGIIGFGVVGKRRQIYIVKNKNYILKCVSDIRFKKDLIKKNIKFYKNYKNLLNKEKLDAVFITLPNYLAAKVTIEFLKKGIHVFCEKPPGKNPAEIREVIKVENKSKNIKLKYGFNHRYHDSVQIANEYIKNKKFGNIINIRGVYGKRKIIEYKKGNWRAEKKYSGGGILMDQGIHLIDLMIFFVGKFKFFKSFISNKYWKYDVEDNAFALMKSSGGIICSIHSSATQWQHIFKIEIFFEKCTLILSGILSGSKSYGAEKLTIIPKKNIKKDKILKKKIFYFKKDNSWKKEVDEFADIIIKNKKILLGNSIQAYNAIKTVYNIYDNDKSWKYK
tara:strand:- start:146 stop:1162 length:1017 start_codon:yes stop_codon:yes gene_type:complete